MAREDERHDLPDPGGGVDKEGNAGQAEQPCRGWESTTRPDLDIDIDIDINIDVFRVALIRQPCRANIRSKHGRLLGVWELVLVV
jgi:hypothetical protein